MAVRPLHAFNSGHNHLQDDLFDDDDQYDHHNEGDTLLNVSSNCLVTKSCLLIIESLSLLSIVGLVPS